MPYKERTDEDLKVYWTIGEVADIIGEFTSLLRFWEDEFPQLKPKKNRIGNRHYTRKDIHLVLDIHFLTKKVGLGLEGARKVFELGLLDKYKEMYNE